VSVSIAPLCRQLPTHHRHGTRDDRQMSTDIRVKLGKRVRQLRQERGWTQVELADLLGIDRSYLSEIETGKKDPSLRVLKTFADGFHLTLSELLYRF
jgi:DNA-binding XRE family transcriptional regulator